MPLRIISSRTSRSLTYRLRIDTAVRTTSSHPQFLRVASSTVPRRAISSKDRPLPKNDNPDRPGPNQEQLPHVSEEAAAQNRIEGKPAPEMEQGTPVQEILARDKKGRETAPEDLKDEFGNIKKGKVESEFADSSSSASIGTGKGGQHGASGTRSYSTSARRLQDLELSSSQSNQLPPDMMIRRDIEPSVAVSNLPPGLKFELPAVPLTKSDHKDHRYDPCITHLTMLLMREGKKSQAQSNMARILNHLRTSPPPQVNPQRPLLPGAPPPSHLPLNPSLYLQLAVDSVAPLLRLRNQKGIAGGGASVQIPVPLRLRQRRTTAFKWILEAAEKKASRGSGKGQFAQKVADEVIAVVEGKSGVWEKRLGLHKLGTAARSNIGRGSARKGRSRRSIFSI